jgi:phosphate acetyltransferase
MSLATEVIGQLVADKGPMAEIRRRAAARAASVVLCEGEDKRVVAAALALRELGIARPVLLGRAAAIRSLILAEGADPGSVEILQASDDLRATAAEFMFERRGNKGLERVQSKSLATDPLFLGASLVGLGRVDAMVAGATRSTADVVRAGLWCVGAAEGIRTVSGSFLMLPPKSGRPLLFADSAVVIEPDADQLVDIAQASAAMWRALFGTEPGIAALSFSTQGSADHPNARKMALVAERLRECGLRADGELQVDAALVEEIAAAKVKGSEVAGRADVLLFPDLQAGNIGYKLVQRLGGWRAVGPLVQGLDRPVFDLSRGCTASEIVDTVSIATLTAPSKPTRDQR